MIITHMRMHNAIQLKVAIRFYLKTGMQVTRGATPTQLLKAAGRITEKTYKRGQLQQAQIDLGQWLEVHRLMGENLQDVRPV